MVRVWRSVGCDLIGRLNGNLKWSPRRERGGVGFGPISILRAWVAFKLIALCHFHNTQIPHLRSSDFKWVVCMVDIGGTNKMEGKA